MFGQNSQFVFRNTDKTKKNYGSSYPIYMAPRDSTGDEEEAIREAIASNPKDFERGTLVMDSEYISYLQGKTREYREVDYQTWLANQMDLSAPYKRAYWKKTLPEAFKKRFDFIDSQVEYQKTLAKMKAFYPCNDKEYRIKYDLEAGFRQKPQSTIIGMSQVNINRESYNALPSLFQKSNIFPSQNMQIDEYSVFGTEQENQKDPKGLSYLLSKGTQFFG